MAGPLEPQHRGTAALLPWTVTAEELVPPPPGATAAAPSLELSVVDRIAAPTAFLHQALVFERGLDATTLRAALVEALALFPTLACRATKDQDGAWALIQPSAGALLTLGSSDVALQRLAPLPLPPLADLVDLGAELFGHLSPTLPASDAAAVAAHPLLHIVLVTLSAGGAVLGLRSSHMVSDFGTLRAVLHHLARAYSGRTLTAGDVPAPGAPAVAALAAATLPLPPGFQPWNYRPLPPDVGTQFAALVAQPQLQALSLHISVGWLEELKAQATAELAATPAGTTAGGEGGTTADTTPTWVSTNDALMAWLWKALAGLPCRRGAVTPFNLALDMRSRMQLPGGHSPLPRWVYGNLATSAFCPELDAASLSLGQVAVALRKTVVSDADKFAGDVAFATQHAASGCSCSSLAILPVLRILEAVAAGQVPVLMASNWTLDHAADADFGGQLPLSAAASFGSALMFPVAVSQPATPAAGGGVMLHLWLWPDEARELRAALAAGS